MSTIIKNNKEYYPFWILTINGPKRVYYLIGEASEITRFNRALIVMEYFERNNKTKSIFYKMARQIAIKEMLESNNI